MGIDQGAQLLNHLTGLSDADTGAVDGQRPLINGQMHGQKQSDLTCFQQLMGQTYKQVIDAATN